jgi:hypothetical protein
MELGPELFQLLNSKKWVGNQTPVVYGARGLSSEQIASIEAQLGFRVPDDFAYLFRNLQDPLSLRIVAAICSSIRLPRSV